MNDPQPMPTDAEREARMFHEAYERLAPSFGYETRSGTREFDPASPNGKLMVAVCGELQSSRAPAPVGAEPVAWRVRRLDSPNYWIIFLHKPVDALMDPEREVQPLYTAQSLAMGRVPLSDEQILELAGLALNRRVCASTCMTRKIDKNPCECYPDMRSGEALTLARSIETAQGIKQGGQRD